MLTIYKNANLSNLETYVPGLSAEFVASKYNIAIDSVSKLASAENPFGPSPKAKEAIKTALKDLCLYPEWTSKSLRDKIGEKFHVTPENVVCGAGETEIISFIIRAFANEGDEILMPLPTFPIYHIAATAENRKPVFVSMDEECNIDVEKMVSAITAKTRVIFLTSPNNPTGKLLDHSIVKEICRRAPDVLVVLDEAYFHFAGANACIPLLNECKNLIILRTFSKVYGLASLRVGFGIADSEIIEPLLKIKPTWNLGRIQLAGSIAALDDEEHVNRTLNMINDMRDYVTSEVDLLKKFKVVGQPKANFFLVKILDSKLNSTSVYEHLLKKGVIVKDCSVSYLGLGDRYLRVDVSLKKHMDHFIEVLGEI
jgi:histidinol-phosphate aminotransferase